MFQGVNRIIVTILREVFFSFIFALLKAGVDYSALERPNHAVAHHQAELQIDKNFVTLVTYISRRPYCFGSSDVLFGTLKNFIQN